MRSALVQQVNSRSPSRNGHRVVIPAQTRPNNSASSLDIPRCPSPRYSTSRLEALVCGESSPEGSCYSRGQGRILYLSIGDGTIPFLCSLHRVNIRSEGHCQCLTSLFLRSYPCTIRCIDCTFQRLQPWVLAQAVIRLPLLRRHPADVLGNLCLRRHITSLLSSVRS